MRSPANRARKDIRRISKSSRRSGRETNTRRPRYELLEERTLMTVYNIGPSQPYTTIGSFPWSSLQPGDTVDIHWQAGGYHEKLLISESGTASAPINIVGLPGPNGQKPIIDGENATTSSQFQYWYNPIQEDAVVLIARSATEASGYQPSYINISNLEIKDGYQSYNFTDNTGKTQTYGAFAASVWIEGASNITLQDDTLDNSGQGLFALTDDSNGMMTSNLMIEGNYFYNNGVPGSEYEHNSYCEVNGITYQYNYYGPLRAGSEGLELKDRSAGCIIRDNYFTPGATILDLVDAEDSPTLAALPSYQNTYVYGNIIDNTGPDVTPILIEFGGDSGDTAIYRPNLYFYDNTVLNEGNPSWGSVIFDSLSSGQTVYAANNIFYNAPAAGNSSPSGFNFSYTQGNINFSSTNWVSPGWQPSKFTGSSYTGTISGTSTFFVDPNNNPGFLDANGGNLAGSDLHLLSTSNAIGIAASLNSSWPAVTEEYLAPTSGTPRTSVADVGAYQAGPTIPVVINGGPAPAATNVPLGTAVTATFNESVQAC